MQDAEILAVPGYGELTWKSSKETKKKLFDLDRFMTEQPDLYAQYLRTITTGGSRTFFDKPAKEEA